MPTITNISLAEALSGNYTFPFRGDKQAVMIRIQDKNGAPFLPIANQRHFQTIYIFNFDDVEGGSNAIKTGDARNIAYILKKSKEKDLDVVVHCHAGIRRSGAVVEAAVAALGYQDLGRYRQPNLRVKREILDWLDYGYDPQRSAFNDRW